MTDLHRFDAVLPWIDGVCIHCGARYRDGHTDWCRETQAMNERHNGHASAFDEIEAQLLAYDRGRLCDAIEERAGA